MASCVGRNLVFLTEGDLRELPLEIVDLKQVYNLISTAWKCKVSIPPSFLKLHVSLTCKPQRLIIDSATAVRDYLERKKNTKQDVDRTAPDFY